MAACGSAGTTPIAEDASGSAVTEGGADEGAPRPDGSTVSDAGDATNGPKPDAYDATTDVSPCIGKLGCEVIAAGQAGPYGIAVDGTGVYWANIGTAPRYVDGAIMKLDAAGNAPTALAAGERGPRFVALDESNVYFTNYYGWTVRKVPKTGGTVVTIAQGSSTRGIAVGGGNVFFANGSAMGTIARVSVMGGNVEMLAAGQASPMALAIDATTLFWTNFSGSTVASVDASDATDASTPVRIVADQQGGPAIVAAAGGRVVWSDSATGTVMALNAASVTPTALATGQKTPWGVALSGDVVYFTNAGDGTINRTPVAGGTVEPLASGARTPRLIAVDDHNVYVTDEAAVTILKLGR
jgi:hypothetical protein